MAHYRLVVVALLTMPIVTVSCGQERSGFVLHCIVSEATSALRGTPPGATIVADSGCSKGETAFCSREREGRIETVPPKPEFDPYDPCP